MLGVDKLNRFFTALATVMALIGMAALARAATQQAYIKASNTGVSDFFGSSVAIWGDTMVVGASKEKSNATGVNGNQSDNSASFSGAAYIFVRSGTNWVQQAYLKASNTEAGDRFGYAVAIYSNTVVVSAAFEDSNATGVNGDQSNNSSGNAGAVYVFVRNGTNWTQQAYLKAHNTGTQNIFGQSVAIFGDTIVIGAIQEGADIEGAAYVFVRNGTNWNQQAYLKADVPEGAGFGYSCAIWGDTALVGAAVLHGAAYVFVRDGTNWTQQTEFHGGWGDNFGASVSLSGETAIVGVPLDDSNATGVNGDPTDVNPFFESGAAIVFVRDGTNWIQQAYLKAHNTDDGDVFGSSVSISGDTVVVGAPNEASDATGINGDGSNNNAYASGAAYVFVRGGTNWTQQAYLKTSNSAANDIQGNERWGVHLAVAIFGTTVLFAKPQENSNATGVNGDQSNNAAGDSGAVFVFAGLSVGPKLNIESDGAVGYFLRWNGAAGITYQLERATNVTGPWASNATFTALSAGLIEFHDTNAPSGQAFYRVAQQ